MYREEAGELVATLRALGSTTRTPAQRRCGRCWGSDSPNIPYRYACQLEALDRLDVGDDR